MGQEQVDKEGGLADLRNERKYNGGGHRFTKQDAKKHAQLNDWQWPGLWYLPFNSTLCGIGYRFARRGKTIRGGIHDRGRWLERSRFLRRESDDY
jgi:hypothetical protein